MLEQYFYIAELIARKLSGTLQPEEERKLENWRHDSAENEALYQKICDKEHIAQHCIRRQAFDKQKGWQDLERKNKRLRHKRYFLNICKYAALLAIPVIICVMVVNQPQESATVTAVAKKADVIVPGEKKAILTLDNGKEIDLLATGTTKIEEKDGTAINIDSTTLNYRTANKNLTAVNQVYNKVEIPRGGEYSLVLSDGTKVYLNAMSSLRFPVQFTGAEREVELRGEAYFEVSKSEKPFIVKTRTAQVEVLGTKFNVSAYEDEAYEATLLTGSVKVYSRGASRLLKPSEQVRIHPQGGAITVRSVDPFFYTSWIQGKINFKDQRLEEILRTLSRWYDMNVVYKNEQVKNLRFGCSVNRYKEITPFLELLESTGKVTIKTQGKNIIINN